MCETEQKALLETIREMRAEIAELRRENEALKWQLTQGEGATK